jgi:integrase
MPSIQKRPNGRWRIRFQDSTGTWRSRHFDTEAKAKQQLALEVADVARGQWVDWRAGKVKFGVYAEQWFAQQLQHRENTRALTRSRLDRHLLPFFENRPMVAITRSEVKSWVAGRAQELKPRTVEAVYRLLAQIFLSAIEDRMLVASPCRKIELPEIAPAEQLVPLTVEQVAVLASAMPAELADCVWLAAGSGARVSEMLGTTLDRIDFLRRTYRIDRQLVKTAGGQPVFGPTKTKASSATLPLGQTTIDRLAAHVKTYGTGPAGLLFAPGGRALYRARFSELWATAVTAAKLPKGTRFHELRHFYASMLIREGLSPKAVQVRMRHATMQETWDTYGHLWPDDEDRTRDAIDKVLGAVPQQSLDSGTAGQSHAQSGDAG